MNQEEFTEKCRTLGCGFADKLTTYASITSRENNCHWRMNFNYDVERNFKKVHCQVRYSNVQLKVINFKLSIDDFLALDKRTIERMHKTIAKEEKEYDDMVKAVKARPAQIKKDILSLFS